ncbi:hypothetical protein ARMSODRAFT_956738, partial [Armillaria solidipes]
MQVFENSPFVQPPPQLDKLPPPSILPTTTTTITADDAATTILSYHLSHRLHAADAITPPVTDTCDSPNGFDIGYRRNRDYRRPRARDYGLIPPAGHYWRQAADATLWDRCSSQEN